MVLQQRIPCNNKITTMIPNIPVPTLSIFSHSLTVLYETGNM